MKSNCKAPRRTPINMSTTPAMPTSFSWAAVQLQAHDAKLDTFLNRALELARETTKENNMENTMEMQQRRYMSDRLWSIKDEANTSLMNQFNILEPAWPTSAKDLVEKITSGKFTLKTKNPPEDDEDDENECYAAADIFHKIDWRDPKGPQPDREGCKKALDSLNIAYKNLKDSIQLQPIDKAVAEFEAFKNWTYVQ